MAFVQFSKVSLAFGDRDILKDVSVNLSEGTKAALTGANGSGKSTLMKILYKEETPTTGTVLIGGINIANLPSDKVPNLRRCMGIVFQDYKLLQNQTVYDNISYVIRTLGISSSDIRTRVTGALKVVGLLDKAHAKPSELSGGEQQRVSIARALVNGPPLLIADEPTGNLDPETGNLITQLLHDICTSGTAVIMTTHNHNLLKSYPGRVIEFNNKNITELDIENKNE